MKWAFTILFAFDVIKHNEFKPYSLVPRSITKLVHKLRATDQFDGKYFGFASIGKFVITATANLK